MSGLLSIRMIAVFAAAIALFAVAGFAASFDINGDKDIVNAEGETLVVDCGDVQVTKTDMWKNGNDDEGDGGFYVDEIKIDGPNNCKDKYFILILTDGNGNAIKIYEGAAFKFNSNGDATVDVNDGDVSVSRLKDIHILVSDTPQDAAS